MSIKNNNKLQLRHLKDLYALICCKCVYSLSLLWLLFLLFPRHYLLKPPNDYMSIDLQMILSIGLLLRHFDFYCFLMAAIYFQQNLCFY